jgi:flagellar biosynthesis/type III secretory pathway protein FliH
LRPQKPWQAAANLISKSERRLFASANWEKDVPQVDGFEETELHHTNPKEFAAMQVQPMMHPLPKHIMTALALLDEAQKKHEERGQFGEQATTSPSDESPNAHLPFVPMVYQAVDWSGKPIVVQEEAAPVVQAEAQAPSEETPEPSEQEAQAQPEENQAQPEPEPIAAKDDAEVESPTDYSQALSSGQEIQDIAQEDAFPAETLADQEPAEPNDSQAGFVQEAAPETVEAELIESELNTEPEFSAEELVADAQEVAQEAMDVQPEAPQVPGIAEEEVARREQAHYEKGLEEGQRKAREAMQEELDAKCTVLEGVTQQLNELLNDSSKLYEPIKRLSMHLAEQIVLGELKTPTDWIERMVQRCLDEVHVPAQGLVVVELNARDKQRLQAQDSKLLKSVRLEVNEEIQPGSVRVLANGMVIEEFLSHRLAALVRSLSIDETQWAAHSSLNHVEETLQEMEGDDDRHS